MPTRICPRCKEEKDLGEFQDVRRWLCHPCRNDYVRELRQKQREAYLILHPKAPKPTHKVCSMCQTDKSLEEFNWANKSKGIRSTYCKPCQGKRAYQDQLRRGNPARESLRYRCSKYGISLERYDELHSAQNGKCALCGKEETHPVTKGGKIRRLAIDHSHDSGKSRGLLCFRCNTAFHQLEKHGREWAHNAISYLDRYK